MIPTRDVRDNTPSLLNVGGGSKDIAIPAHYAGWTHLLLDIDPAGRPDVVGDARELASLDAARFDAVYCSHNLEHYHHHHVPSVLAGFLHVLKPDGFAEIYVPDLRSLMKLVLANDMDIEDTLYTTARGPIAVRDMIYGWGKQIETSGVDFYAHKTGFMAPSLRAVLTAAGFAHIVVEERPQVCELRAVAFKGLPTDRQRALLGI